MSNAFDNLGRILDVRMPWDVLLSVNAGVPCGGCGWPSSSSVVHIGTARWKPRYVLPVSASDADCCTFLMAVHMTWSGPFGRIILFVLVGSLVRIYHPDALDLALGRTRYAASVSKTRIMSLA